MPKWVIYVLGGVVVLVLLLVVFKPKASTAAPTELPAVAQNVSAHDEATLLQANNQQQAQWDAAYLLISNLHNSSMSGASGGSSSNTIPVTA